MDSNNSPEQWDKMDRTKRIHTNIDPRTQEETSPEVSGAFPYRGGRDDFSYPHGRVCPWHWHGDAELFYVERGSLEYRVPGGRQVFHEGDAGFVNAGVPHSTRALGNEPCVQQEHIFLPRLVAGESGSSIERNYVRPLVENAAADLLHIPASDPACAALRAEMDRALRAFQEAEPGFEILVREALSRAWLLLLPLAPAAEGVRRRVEQDRIKSMLHYVQTHFDEAVTLEQIAAAASISPREADRCFRRQLGASPFGYLQDYRLERAAELLRESDLPGTDLALRCGFGSAGDVGKLFRARYGCTPTAFRGANDRRNET